MNFAGQQTLSPRLSWLLRSACCLALVTLLTACGFAMRGVTPMPFDTLYVGLPANTQFGADVRRALQAASPNTELVDTPKKAQAILQQVNEQRTLREVSLNAQGRVEEYELGINFTFRLIDAKGRALIPDTTLSIFREMPYDSSVIQAKEGQIETLYRSMQRDLVSRLIRRLTAPDVKRAMEDAKTAPTPDTPLFDPTKVTPQQHGAPTQWQTPSTTGPEIFR